MPGPVSARLAKLTARLGELDRVVVTVAAEAIADALDKQVTRDTGGDGALSGISNGRYKLTTKLTPLSSPAGVRIRPSPKQSGMWTILDSGRTGYTVAARPRRRRSKGTKKTSSRGRAMNIGGAWRTGPWHVGGTSGKRTWSRAIGVT